MDIFRFSPQPFKLVYSTLYEVLVDFTRDYDVIKQAIAKIEHYDKTSLENMLHAVKSMLLSSWGSQNQSHVLVFTDCGIGLGPTSIRATIDAFRNSGNRPSGDATTAAPPVMCLPFTFASKLSFVCIGLPGDAYFREAITLYQELLDVSGQNGELFTPEFQNDAPLDSMRKPVKRETATACLGGWEITRKLVSSMCETNYKPFEAILKCGGYSKLSCEVNVWPQPTVRFEWRIVCLNIVYIYMIPYSS